MPKVIFDFKYGVDINLKNKEVEMPFEEIPRKGDYISDEVEKEDGTMESVFCSVNSIHWNYTRGKLDDILVNLDDES